MYLKVSQKRRQLNSQSRFSESKGDLGERITGLFSKLVHFEEGSIAIKQIEEGKPTHCTLLNQPKDNLTLSPIDVVKSLHDLSLLEEKINSLAQERVWPFLNKLFKYHLWDWKITTKDKTSSFVTNKVDKGECLSDIGTAFFSFSSDFVRKKSVLHHPLLFRILKMRILDQVYSTLEGLTDFFGKYLGFGEDGINVVVKLLGKVLYTIISDKILKYTLEKVNTKTSREEVNEGEGEKKGCRKDKGEGVMEECCEELIRAVFKV